MDFKNTLIIMTSNVGSSVIEKGGTGLGFQLDASPEDTSYNRIKTLVNEELKQYFRPEFLNRLDEIIVFRQLTKGEVKEIADIMLAEVFKRAEEKGIKIDVTERFKDRLVDEGYNPAYGARPLRRAIMRLLEDSMAERMLAGDITEGDSVIIDGARACVWRALFCASRSVGRDAAHRAALPARLPRVLTLPSLLACCSGRGRPDQRAERRQEDDQRHPLCGRY